MHRGPAQARPRADPRAGDGPQRGGPELREQVGVQLQESELPDKLTVAEAIDLYGSFYRTPADGRALLDVLGLAGERDTRYRKLSGGQKQRLSIALALIGRPGSRCSTSLRPASTRRPAAAPGG